MVLQQERTEQIQRGWRVVARIGNHGLPNGLECVFPFLGIEVRNGVQRNGDSQVIGDGRGKTRQWPEFPPAFALHRMFQQGSLLGVWRRLIPG